MIKQLIREYYPIDIRNITKMSGGWSSNVYLIETDQTKYVLKDIPISESNHAEAEGEITDYLRNRGLQVSELIKTKSGKYAFSADGKQYHLQKFIDGGVFEMNTAPDWFMVKSARALGKIHHELSKLDKFPIGMGEGYFKYSSPESTRKSYLRILEHAKKINDEHVIKALESRIRQIEKLSAISFDYSKFTISNTHGDYYISQMICKDEDFTIIDWTSACVHPICWEIIRSFVYADIECKNGSINTKRFTSYLQEYLKHYHLNKYDLEMMPYMFYFQISFCNNYYSYYFDDNEFIDKTIALKMSDFTTNLMNWFFSNVEDFSKKLKALA